jgi:DNA-binding PadR family transcriptional regulator
LPSEAATCFSETSDLLISKLRVTVEMRGLGISRIVLRIPSCSSVVKLGSLSPTLHGMQEGRIPSFWEESEKNRRKKRHPLTRAGRKRPEVEARRWSRTSCAIAQALETS